MSEMDFDEWLDSIPDEDVDGFEDTARAEGIKYAKEKNDAQCQDCMTKYFSGDNPREWAEDAIESISANCKTRAQAKVVVMNVVSRALAVLNG